MRAKHIKYCFLTFFTLLCISCDSFLDIPGPATEVDAADVYKNNEMPVMALAQIYGAMFNKASSPYNIARLAGLACDELMLPSDQGITEFYKNRISPENTYLLDYWTTCFGHIRDANDVYQNSQSSLYLDDVIRKQVMAEALFLRAYWFFNLLNLFGDIPVPTSADAQENISLYRLPTDKVYTQIESDLIAAQKDLDNNYLSGDRRSVSDERVLPNKASATALLARVYLYQRKYTEAEEQASTVIAMNDTYSLVPLDSVFLKNSKEAIWQLMPANPNIQAINTSEGNGFILEQTPTIFGQQVLTPLLVNAFELGDQRRQLWIGEFHDSDSIYYYPHKYREKSGTELKEYSMMLRLAEQYLIRSEARAYLNNLEGACADLNMIRKRAGLPLLVAAGMDQLSILKAILKERQTELFTEQGHRWFDLKRTGNLDAAMRAKSSIWFSTAKLWPIPEKEIVKDPNLIQNEGY